MGENKRIVIPFYKKYEPAMFERYKNVSPKYEHEFNYEMGLVLVSEEDTYEENYMTFEIVDEKLFMLAQIRYGF